MLLRHIGLSAKADRLSAAIDKAALTCPVTGTREGNTCRAFGDAVTAAL